MGNEYLIAKPTQSNKYSYAPAPIIPPVMIHHIIHVMQFKEQVVFIMLKPAIAALNSFNVMQLEQTCARNYGECQDTCAYS